MPYRIDPSPGGDGGWAVRFDREATVVLVGCGGTGGFLAEAICRLLLGRKQGRYGPPVKESEQELQGRINALRTRLDELDAQISPLARTSTELSNPTWGLLMRAGNDKSHLARQVERYADIYTSRVSNLLYATPYVYLRSPRGSLPHDPALPAAHPPSLEAPEQG